MTGDVINLRSVRKNKARSAKEAQAQTNRRKYGRSRSEKDAAKNEAERNRRNLEGARRDGDEG
ncbi:MAG: DUF4169 family protein [Sphingomonadaceae bacterium]|nr:DUF4169 family protein [Sphingomonadaceae bacterium]